MKIKVSELKDRALNYAVAVAEGYKPEEINTITGGIYVCALSVYYYPSSGPAGDDIIDREKISVTIGESGLWVAFSEYNYGDVKDFMVAGTTRREAAMRCYVLSKLGGYVEIPEELL